MFKILFSLLFFTSSMLAFADEPDDPIDVQNSGRSGYYKGALKPDDLVYRAIEETPLYRDFLPAQVDLSPSLPKVGDQGKQGSCVAWAVGYAARSYYVHTLESRPVKSAGNIPSPTYIYNSIRTGDCDVGSRITDALSLLRAGAISLKDMPYSDRSCPTITEQQTEQASDFRIKGYKRVDYKNSDQIKAELAAGNPVIFAFRHIPSSFDRARGKQVFHWDGATPDDGSRHAMTAVGYDDVRQAFRIINSWGHKWGDGGLLWVDYDTFTLLADEAYVIEPLHRASPPPPRPEPLPRPDIVSLPELPCSKLALRSDNGKLSVVGFVGYPQDLETLSTSIPPSTATVAAEVRPWPQCEALLTLDSLLTQPEAPTIRLPETKAEKIYIGETSFPVVVESPAMPSFLYVSYLQADGSVVNLAQPDEIVPQQAAPSSEIVFGDGLNGNPRFVVSPPYGREMIVSISSKAPLFDVPLPARQTYREYLSAVRKALLAEQGALKADRTASASVAFFETREH